MATTVPNFKMTQGGSKVCFQAPTFYAKSAFAGGCAGTELPILLLTLVRNPRIEPSLGVI
jgi:hypothetical protein